MMIRTRLTTVLATCVGLVFVMAVLLFWGPQQMERQLERSLWAHQETDHYLRLSSDAYRYFWQMADGLLTGADPDAADARASRARLREGLLQLERTTLDELQFVGDTEPEERYELEQIQMLADAIAAGIVAFNRAREPAAGETRAQHLDLLARKIDRDFARLIEQAIEDERAEAEAADERARALGRSLRYAAAALACLAALLVTGLGARLLRSIQAPIAKLMQGTEQIAAGQLGHRIELAGRHEFAQLARSFNGMAAELERQRGQLMHAQADLEYKVRERTVELERTNLTLQRLDEVRRRLFADISHELRTPLTIIGGEAEVTLRSRTRSLEDYRTTLGRILDLTGQVARLVEDLMFLARSDAADLRFQPRPLQLGAVLRDAAEDLQALVSGKEIALTVEDGGAEEPTIQGDPDRLAQLLLILVDNACRYTRPGGRITVARQAVADAAVLTVTDTGIGIPAQELTTVFDRYFRGREAQRLAPKGSGLGLHVAKTIVQAHRGTIAVDSRAGQGTTVTVRLPLATQTTQARSADADSAG